MVTTRRQFLATTGGLAGAALLAACDLALERRPSAEAPDRLVVNMSGGIAVLDAGRRAVVVLGGPAVAGADWTRLFATGPNAERTWLRTINATTGAELARALAPGSLAVRVVAPSGRLVALTEPAAGATPYAPVPREQTTIVVADPAGERPPRRLELAGNYEPEAFATDEQSLFVIEHLPPMTPDRYRVRVSELASGAIGPLATRLKTPVLALAEEEMRGDGRQAVLAPDHRRLYTLYTHQPDHLHTRDRLAGRRGGDGAPIHAFVHILSLDEGWAFCLDLPAPFGLGAPAAHTLALASDGRRLFVADLASGRLAIADTETLEVRRIVALDSTGGEAGAAAAFAPDDQRLYLGGGASVLAFDSSALALIAHWPVDEAIRGLAPSVDGKRLYVGQAGRVIGLDTADGRELGRLTVARQAE